jgi:hypothetical protein
MDIKFNALTPEQEKLLREILTICHFFQTSLSGRLTPADNVLASLAKEIGIKMLQLERVSPNQK